MIKCLLEHTVGIIYKKAVVYYYKNELKKFNEYVKQKSKESPLFNLNDLKQNESYLNRLMKDIQKNQKDYNYSYGEMTLYRSKKGLEVVLCDYYYHTHPDGAWLFLGIINDNCLDIYDEHYYYFYKRICNNIIKPYYKVCEDITQEQIDNYEIHALSFYN